MKKLKVHLADLRHNHNNMLTSDAMPLGMGYMKAYMDVALEQVDAQIFVYPHELEQHILDHVPDVLMLTNYMWNEQLSHHFARHVKKLNPGCLVVMGGPNIAIEENRKKEYLQEHPHIDIYVNGEGDFLSAHIVSLFLSNGCDIDRTLREKIHSSTYRHNGKLIVTELEPRTGDINAIPSPWLNGVMDKFFDGKLVPLYESNRGCPFSCSFCVQGTKWYNKVNHFELDRTKKELYYIAEKISSSFPEQKMLRIADPNFGMFKRDIDLAGYMGETQAKYKFPLIIDATTGKNRPDNIIQAMEKVNGALILYQAVQSLNQEVLENINRSNIQLSAYEKLQVHIKGRGMRSSSDLIIGLPGESITTHFEALEKLINAGTSKLNNFQAMMLKGSELEANESRKQYHFGTKFRLLPKCFGNYFNQVVFDYEEIIIDSNTMSFDDYLKGRQMHLILSLFWNDSRFSELVDMAAAIGVSGWEWIRRVSLIAGQQDQKVFELVNSFLTDTQDELFDSPRELIEFYSHKENFDLLALGIKGDNLIYKYRGIALLEQWDCLAEVAVDATRYFYRQQPGHEEIANSDLFWSDLVLYLSNSYAFLQPDRSFSFHENHEFSYDLLDWMADGMPKQISKYYRKDKLLYEFVHPDEIRSVLMEALSNWDLQQSSYSMLIRRISVEWLNRQVFIRSPQRTTN